MTSEEQVHAPVAPPRHPASRPRGGGRHGGTIAVLAVVMAVAASGLAAPLLLDDPQAALPAPAWLAVVLIFALCEALVVYLPATRHSHTFSLREIPAVLGLAFLAPQQYLSAYVVGSLLTLVIWSRQRGLKLAFNIAMFALEASVGLIAYRWVLGTGEASEPRGWVAALVAVLLTDLISAAAVGVAISLAEGRLQASLVREIVTSTFPASLVNTCAALIIVILVVLRPQALPLLALVVGLLLLAYRSYVQLGTGYARLQALYRFVGSTGRVSELDEALATVLEEARDLLRAERAGLVVMEAQGSQAVLYSLGRGGQLSSSSLTDDQMEVSWWADAATGSEVLRRNDAREASRSTDLEPRDGIAVPLESQGYRGVLLVSDRTFEKETFGAQDVRLFETLAAHAAVTLEKARLVDRLRRVAVEREYDALHDALTGLPNRRAFNEAVARTLAAEVGGAVLLMDLDDFKDVNDTLGHRAGDELLQITGRRLHAAVVEDGPEGADPTLRGSVARLGGDEFAVLLPGVGEVEALARAHELLASVTAPVPLQDITLTTTASFGVAPIPPGARDSDELLVHADVAMYAAKAAGDGVASYVPEDTDAVHRRLALAGELPAAIDERRFEVWCQPQIEARTGSVTGVEALLRWWHPVYGWVPPGEVVAIAERTGLLGRLTLAVLAESLRLRSTWARAGLELDVSVNVTARDISDLALPGSVGALLAATGTPPASLVLEITESGVMSDPERSLEVLAALGRLGVGVSVDDFGTGHSSLAYLERLPVHEVKIDQSFVKRLEREATDSTVVRSIVLLAHDLGMRVVAEGVESDVARERVQALGCELVQGFVVARPMPGDQIPRWVDEHAPGPLVG